MRSVHSLPNEATSPLNSVGYAAWDYSTAGDTDGEFQEAVHEVRTDSDFSSSEKEDGSSDISSNFLNNLKNRIESFGPGAIAKNHVGKLEQREDLIKTPFRDKTETGRRPNGIMPQKYQDVVDKFSKKPPTLTVSLHNSSVVSHVPSSVVSPVPEESQTKQDVQGLSHRFETKISKVTHPQNTTLLSPSSALSIR